MELFKILMTPREVVIDVFMAIIVNAKVSKSHKNTQEKSLSVNERPF